jgi:hypothetical protein
MMSNGGEDGIDCRMVGHWANLGGSGVLDGVPVRMISDIPLSFQS